MHTSSSNINMLKQQIEEERSKFAQIMTNWSQEVTSAIENNKIVYFILYNLQYYVYDLYYKLLNILKLYFGEFC